MKNFIASLTLAALSLFGAAAQNQTPGQQASKQLTTGQQAPKQQARGHQVRHITAAEFKSGVFDYTAREYKFLGKRPVFIDFYATWCGPCKMLSPIVERLSGEYDGQVDVYKVDVDKEPEIAAAFGVSSIPTLLFVPQTSQPQMAKGYIPYEALRQAFDTILLGKPAPAQTAQ